MNVKLLFKRNPISFVFIIILFFSILFSLASIILSMSERNRLGRLLDLNQLNNKKTVLEKALEKVSSETNLSYVNKEVETSDPIEFKQLLLDTLEKVNDRAKVNSLSLPGSLGFDDYRANLPRQDDIPVLSMELDVLSDLVDSMVSAKVNRLVTMEYRQQPVFGEGQISGVLELGIVFDCRMQGLIDFLRKLSISRFFFDISLTSIESTNGNLRVNIILLTRTFYN